LDIKTNNKSIEKKERDIMKNLWKINAAIFFMGIVSVLGLADFQTRLLDKKAFQMIILLCLVGGLFFGFW